MPSHAFDKDEWALILGGSSGFGLATAHKLSEEGLNVCVVHRDRRGRGVGSAHRVLYQERALGDGPPASLTFRRDRGGISLGVEVRLGL